MSEQPVLTQLEDGILSIILNRPEKKNAITSEMYTLMHQGFEEEAANSDVRVVLLKGNGGVFTAGNDLNDFANWLNYENNLDELPVLKLIRSVLRFPKPVVVAVEGYAVGLGSTILPHCDVVVAGESTQFSLPFVRLGAVPEFGSSFLLPLFAGRLRASHVLMLGEPFDVHRARELGLVSEIVADEAVQRRALERAKTLADLPADTLRKVKALINYPEYVQQLEARVEEETRLFYQSLTSPEHKEAVKAFFEKRPPNFRQFK